MDAERLNDFPQEHRTGRPPGLQIHHLIHRRKLILSEDESFSDEVLIKNIKSILPDLEKHDLILGLEIHGEYGTGESLYRIYKGVGSERVGG